jgi:DNA-binding CsgD family transcriptional regulator
VLFASAALAAAHVEAILAKLDVSNRVQAAHELNRHATHS